MKKISKFILSFALVAAVLSGCDDGDALVDQIVDDTTRGAILRTRANTGSFDIFRTDDTFSLTIEEQDQENGDLLDRVEIALSFTDNNDGNGDDSVASVLFRTLEKGDFSLSERGLPEATTSFTLAEALAGLGLTLPQVLPGDAITANLTLFLTDGRTFSRADASGNVTGGSFFASPYRYTLTLGDGIDFEISDNNPNVFDVTEGAMAEDYSVSISIDDDAEGALVETLNVYRAFNDNTTAAGPDLSEDEALFSTFTVADLTLTMDGARTLDLVITPAELLGMTLTEADVAFGDNFTIRYELLTADGRSVTTTTADTEYFDLIDTFNCVQLNADAPFPGEYTINLTDIYGDGWDGAFIEVTIDGGTPEQFTIPTGDSATHTFTVPEGAMTLLVTYTNGQWEDEHVYEILDPNGNRAAADGPFPRDNSAPPVAREVEIKVCE